MGFSMTVCFIGIHGMVTEATLADDSGRLFGWLESGVRGGALLAGGAASLLFSVGGAVAPFWWGAGTTFILCLREVYRDLQTKNKWGENRHVIGVEYE